MVAIASDASLRITEIFLSLQGETTFAGLPTVFVRLTGCPLRCNYCDTEYAFHGGQRLELSAILQQVAAHQTQHICVTGGEPLAQPECLTLLAQLCDQGYTVSLETSGALDISGVDARVVRVVDFKTPDSGEASKNLLGNIDRLAPSDQVKFVICSESDYRWALQFVEDQQLSYRVAEVLFSPSWGQLKPAELADWMVRDKPPARYQLQLHKVLWNDEPGR